MVPIQEPLLLHSELDGFGPPFMAHAPASKAKLLAPLTQSDNIGAVIVTTNYTTARAAARIIYRGNPNASILVDNGLYKGKGRQIGAHCIDQDWITMQLGKMALPWALTNSGYIPTGDVTSLRAVLAWGRRSDRIVVTLPLALSWLTVDLDSLIAEIARAQCPVGIILESKADPLATRIAVSGLIRLLRELERVLLLRCDTATLGALAYGAAAVSVGVNSTLRHLYLVFRTSGSPFGSPTGQAV